MSCGEGAATGMDGNIQPGLDGLSSRNKESELGKAAQAGGGFAGTGGLEDVTARLDRTRWRCS